MSKQHVAVIGGGSFGTAVANLIAENGHDVSLWMRNELLAAEINSSHCNTDYLPGFTLSQNLTASCSLESSLAKASLVFMSVPSKSCREMATAVKQYIQPTAKVISTTKGIEADSFKLMSQVLAEELPDQSIGVLSGPNLAKEIMAKHLTGSVIASEDQELISLVQNTLSSSLFRVYSGSDMYGVELGGALKNMYAIMAGLAKALDVGENTIGLLLTRGLAEMSRFAVPMGANPGTFIGLAGVGDLFVTCLSPLSRNYRVGYALGQGKNLDQVVEELGQVAEGVNTLSLVKHKADELDIYMPLVQGLYGVIYGGQAISEVIESMMSGEQNQDVEFIWAGQ
jgi:glycerol-3-phosphate dehydrogenase (NAD(P)+)